jgi:hypothetical protein
MLPVHGLVVAGRFAPATTARGYPTVSHVTLVQILNILGLADQLSRIADPDLDTLVRDLEKNKIPKNPARWSPTHNRQGFGLWRRGENLIGLSFCQVTVSECDHLVPYSKSSVIKNKKIL